MSTVKGPLKRRLLTVAHIEKECVPQPMPASIAMGSSISGSRFLGQREAAC